MLGIAVFIPFAGFFALILTLFWIVTVSVIPFLRTSDIEQVQAPDPGAGTSAA